ncbi:MAG: hypothetical protein MHPSP_002328 [Paramarteilia canceri]
MTEILNRLTPGGIFYNKSGIIYCLSRKECENVSNFLQSKQIKSHPYHAGLDDEARNYVQESWINEDDCKIVCATIAFGMGIDKPDVRFVIHFSIPKSIEGYYQETGRAGRDGINSHCILFYNYGDSMRLCKLLDADSNASKEVKQLHKDNLYRVVQFCENKSECRRSLILQYFGENFNSSDCKRNKHSACDNCLSKITHETKDFTEIAKAIVKTISSECKKPRGDYTMLHYIDVFRGSQAKKIIQCRHERLPIFGMGKGMSNSDSERLFRNMQKFTATYLIPGPQSSLLLSGCVQFKMTIATNRTSYSGSSTNSLENYSSNKFEKINSFASRSSAPEVDNVIEQCYNALVVVAKQIAKSKGGKRYTTIFPVQILRQLSQKMPSSKTEVITHIDGFTATLFDQYFGERLLDVIQSYKKILPHTAVPKLAPVRKSPYFANQNNEEKDAKWLSKKFSKKSNSSTSKISKSKTNNQKNMQSSLFNAMPNPYKK